MTGATHSSAVASAELVRGSATLFGKNALAGALLLTTTRGAATPSSDIDLEEGSFGFRGASVTAAGTASKGHLVGVDGFFLAHATDEQGWRAATDARTRMLFTNIGRKNAESDIAFTALYAHDRILEAGSLPESLLGVDRRANYTPGDFFQPELVHLALRGEHAFGPGMVRGNIFLRRNDIEQFNVNIDAPSTRAFISNKSGGSTAEWSLPAHLGVRPLALTLGAEYTRSDVRYRILAEQTSPLDTLPDGCDPVGGLCTRARVPEDDASLFAQGVLAASPHLSVTFSARGDYVRVPFRDLRDPRNNGTSTFRQISPRLGAKYDIAPNMTAYASVGTGFRAPAALELACADENAPCSLPSALGDDPPLRPVIVHTYEVGADRDLPNHARLSVSGYRTDVHDEIVFVASRVTAGFYQNVARTRRQGVEVSGSAMLPSGFRTRASYAYLDASYESTVALASALAANVAHAGDRLPLSPAHQATLELENVHPLHRSVLDALLSFKATSSEFMRGDDANRTTPLPGYGTADLRLTWDGPRVAVSGHMTNVFDRRYASFGVFGQNPSGAPDSGVATGFDLERFLTPGYPRAITIAVTTHLWR